MYERVKFKDQKRLYILNQLIENKSDIIKIEDFTKLYFKY